MVRSPRLAQSSRTVLCSTYFLPDTIRQGSKLGRTLMISSALFFFGITLIYTGLLALGQHPATGLAVAFIGLILIVKPVLHAVSYCRTNFGGSPRPQVRKIERKAKTRKVHLKIVKPEDDRPTIH